MPDMEEHLNSAGSHTSGTQSADVVLQVPEAVKPAHVAIASDVEHGRALQMANSEQGKRAWYRNKMVAVPVGLLVVVCLGFGLWGGIWGIIDATRDDATSPAYQGDCGGPLYDSIYFPEPSCSESLQDLVNRVKSLSYTALNAKMCHTKQTSAEQLALHMYNSMSEPCGHSCHGGDCNKVYSSGCIAATAAYPNFHSDSIPFSVFGCDTTLEAIEELVNAMPTQELNAKLCQTGQPTPGDLVLYLHNAGANAEGCNREELRSSLPVDFAAQGIDCAAAEAAHPTFFSDSFPLVTCEDSMDDIKQRVEAMPEAELNAKLCQANQPMAERLTLSLYNGMSTYCDRECHGGRCTKAYSQECLEAIAAHPRFHNEAFSFDCEVHDSLQKFVDVVMGLEPLEQKAKMCQTDQTSPEQLALYMYNGYADSCGWQCHGRDCNKVYSSACIAATAEYPNFHSDSIPFSIFECDITMDDIEALIKAMPIKELNAKLCQTGQTSAGDLALYLNNAGAAAEGCNREELHSSLPVDFAAQGIDCTAAEAAHPAFFSESFPLVSCEDTMDDITKRLEALSKTELNAKLCQANQPMAERLTLSLYNGMSTYCDRECHGGRCTKAYSQECLEAIAAHPRFHNEAFSFDCEVHDSLQKFVDVVMGLEPLEQKAKMCQTDQTSPEQLALYMYNGYADSCGWQCHGRDCNKVYSSACIAATAEYPNFHSDSIPFSIFECDITMDDIEALIKAMPIKELNAKLCQTGQTSAGDLALYLHNAGAAAEGCNREELRSSLPVDFAAQGIDCTAAEAAHPAFFSESFPLVSCEDTMDDITKRLEALSETELNAKLCQANQPMAERLTLSLYNGMSTYCDRECHGGRCTKAYSQECLEAIAAHPRFHNEAFSFDCEVHDSLQKFVDVVMGLEPLEQKAKMCQTDQTSPEQLALNMYNGYADSCGWECHGGDCNKVYSSACIAATAAYPNFHSDSIPFSVFGCDTTLEAIDELVNAMPTQELNAKLCQTGQPTPGDLVLYLHNAGANAEGCNREELRTSLPVDFAAQGIDCAAAEAAHPTFFSDSFPLVTCDDTLMGLSERISAMPEEELNAKLCQSNKATGGRLTLSLWDGMSDYCGRECHGGNRCVKTYNQECLEAIAAFPSFHSDKFNFDCEVHDSLEKYEEVVASLPAQEQTAKMCQTSTDSPKALATYLYNGYGAEACGREKI